MTKTTKTVISWLLGLITILLISFAVQIYLVDGKMENAINMLLLTYGFNIIFTGLVLIPFQILLRKGSKQIGSLFLLTSMIKFLLFFVVISPNLSGGVKSYGFAAFFIPYAICLTFEVLVTVRIMKSLEA